MRKIIRVGVVQCGLLLVLSPTSEATTLDVRDFGARGDGTADDTTAFQTALDQAGASGGGIVSVPTGNYWIASSLLIPAHVALEGVWRVPTAWSQHKGSTLLATAGAGQPDATPFITLLTNATVKGITVFYPHQTETNPPTAYPWTIASGGADNCSIVDVLLVNPYQAVDFGTRVAGRHYIRNLYGQALYRGIFVDNCLDIGRIENVHFWPFWKYDESSPVTRFTRENGVAFVFGRTDWEYVSGSFTIFYNVGFHFTEFGHGPGNVLLVQSGADVGPTAVLVDNCQSHAGLSFTNSQLYGDIIVRESNRGPVKFTGCGLFGSVDGARGASHAHIAGTGQVSFVNCHFMTLDPRNRAEPMIFAPGGRLSVVGCEFMDAGKQQLVFGDGLLSAIVTGNRFSGRMRIRNASSGRVEIIGNIDDSPQEEPGAVVVDNSDGDGSFLTEGTWSRASGAGNYLGDTHWAVAGAGECTAAWVPYVEHTGRYEVFVWYGPDPMNDHATNAIFTIHTGKKTKTFEINLKENVSRWHSLGVFRFEAGRRAKVTINNAANGNVLADAVKLVPRK